MSRALDPYHRIRATVGAIFVLSVAVMVLATTYGPGRRVADSGAVVRVPVPAVTAAGQAVAAPAVAPGAIAAGSAIGVGAARPAAARSAVRRGAGTHGGVAAPAMHPRALGARTPSSH